VAFSGKFGQVKNDFVLPDLTSTEKNSDATGHNQEQLLQISIHN
jgi:hypothetical protein